MSDSALFSTGALFSTDYLREAIRDSAAYRAVDVTHLRARLDQIAAAFPQNARTNESQTEDDFIWPVLAALGWSESLRQQNLTVTGRDDVPDGLLFADVEAKAGANALDDQWRRYAHGLAVVESKRWGRPLDRASGRDETTAPSTQMLRYLRRIDDTTGGKLRWGILTNGVRWRLYWAGARSISEEFLEIDLGRVLALDGHGDLFADDGSRDDIRYIYSTFPIVEREEIARWGSYRRRRCISRSCPFWSACRGPDKRQDRVYGRSSAPPLLQWSEWCYLADMVLCVNHDFWRRTRRGRRHRDRRAVASRQRAVEHVRRGPVGKDWAGGQHHPQG